MVAGPVGDTAGEAALLRRAVALARASGAVDVLTLVLLTVAGRGLLEGRFEAIIDATEGLDLAREAGLPNGVTPYLAVLAWFDAVAGRDDEARARADEVAASARVSQAGFANAIAQWGLSLLDLVKGSAEEALTRLTALSIAPPGVGHPYIGVLSAPDMIEACVLIGDAETARRALARLDAFARPGMPAWTLALAARCRALLSHEDAAEQEFSLSLRLHTESNRPFDRARTELLYGEFLRRRRRRTAAREQLRAALEHFDRLGAEPWAERARNELRATGETARKRDPSAAAQLTPQELQIARLVGEGASNKDVAAQLFLSPRTVEYHLRKVFMKLGIASRNELIRQGVTGELVALA